MGIEPPTKIQPTARARWRRPLALFAAPLLIWTPLLAKLTAEDNMEAGRPFALVVLDGLIRSAPLMYGLYGVAALAVALLARRWPGFGRAWTIVPLFGATSALIATLGLWAIGTSGDGERNAGIAVLFGLLVGVIGLPVALIYCLIGQVGWRQS